MPHVLFGLPRSWGMAIAAWGLACAAGLSLFWQYKGTGQQPSAVNTWPHDTGIQLEGQEPTLLMFLHPRCPCTRASLQELERVLREAGKAGATFVVYQPEEAELGWQVSPLIEAIRAWPEAKIVWDERGEIAAKFGAATSGQVQLYRPNGACLFNGGITRMRGHEGINAASEQLLAALQGKQSTLAPTAVYGCALQTNR